MIKIYVTPSCRSCRKAKAWFQENNLSFEERNMISEPLTKEEIKEILKFQKLALNEMDFLL